MIAAGCNKLPTRVVCKRYSVVDRTLERWLKNEALGFPKPLVINNRRYWDEGELVAWERSRATTQVAA